MKYFVNLCFILKLYKIITNPDGSVRRTLGLTQGRSLQWHTYESFALNIIQTLGSSYFKSHVG